LVLKLTTLTAIRSSPLHVSDPVKPAYAECIASWVDDRDERIEIWERIAAIPEPLGYDTETMFGVTTFPI
jgi:hypothetical protein